MFLSGLIHSSGLLEPWIVTIFYCFNFFSNHLKWTDKICQLIVGFWHSRPVWTSFIKVLDWFSWKMCQFGSDSINLFFELTHQSNKSSYVQLWRMIRVKSAHLTLYIIVLWTWAHLILQWAVDTLIALVSCLTWRTSRITRESGNPWCVIGLRTVRWSSSRTCRWLQQD